MQAKTFEFRSRLEEGEDLDDLQSEELKLCLDLAIVSRERILHQLSIMAPAEFTN